MKKAASSVKARKGLSRREVLSGASAGIAASLAGSLLSALAAERAPQPISGEPPDPMQAEAGATQAANNASIDPEHIFVPKPVKNPITVVTEPVTGSHQRHHHADSRAGAGSRSQSGGVPAELRAAEGSGQGCGVAIVRSRRARLHFRATQPAGRVCAGPDSTAGGEGFDRLYGPVLQEKGLSRNEPLVTGHS